MPGPPAAFQPASPLSAAMSRPALSSLLLFLLSCWTTPSQSRVVSPLPSGDVFPCPVDRGDLEACIAKNLNNYIPILAQDVGGVDGLEGGLDPLLIPTAELSYEGESTTLSLALRSLRIAGISSTSVFRVRAKSLEEGKIELICKTPSLVATGVYQSEGTLVTFPLHSYGPFNITLGDLTTHIVVNLESEDDEHLRVAEIGLNVMPSLIDIQAGKQLDEDNNLGVTLNVYLNENSLELYELVRPKLMSNFAALFKDIANSLLSRVHLREVFPNLYLRK